MTHIDESFEERIDRMHFAFPPESYTGSAGGGARYDSELNNTALTTGSEVAEDALEHLAIGFALPTDLSGSPSTIPRTWEEFISIMRVYDGQAAGDPLTGVIFQTFRAEFMLSLGIDPGDLTTDLEGFEVFLESGASGTDRTNFINNLFTRAFDHFIQNYDYDFGTLSAVEAFQGDWSHFLSATNFLADSAVNISPPDFNTSDSENPPNFVADNLTSFESLYFAFVPNATNSDFENRLRLFFDETLNEHGYFIPNHAAGDWFQVVLQERLNITFGSTAVDGTGSENVRIIFELFALLTDMLGTLQKVAATQAERLHFYANMQQAYTDLMSRIPTITVDAILQNTEFSGDEDDNLNRGNQAQQQISSVTQAYTERLRSYRSVWSDEARSHQTSVNQSNETVNQQSNLATSLLQQVSAILQGIFR